MFTFDPDAGSDLVWFVWLIVFTALFGLNEAGRRSKWTGLTMFLIAPAFLTVLWLTILSDTSYMDWFHVAKVYSSTAGCLDFCCIRHIRGKGKGGQEWKISEKRWALCFPPLILAVNILEAVIRDFEVGLAYTAPTVEHLHNQIQYYVGRS